MSRPSRCDDRTEHTERSGRTSDAGYDVVIAGAGVAGLTAATLLTRAGRRVRCLEARSRIGGRAHTITDAGLAIDMGATWFWPNEPNVASLLAQLGLGSFLQDDSGDALFEGPDQSVRRLGGNPLDADSFRFSDGAQSLPEALASLLPAGTVSLEDPVGRIEYDDQRVTVHARSGTLTAGHVILALPPSLVQATIDFCPELPADVQQAAGSTPVWMGDIIKAVAVYDEPFWRRDRLAGSAISYQGPFREIHDHSGPGVDGAGAIFGFAPSPQLGHLDDDAITEAFRGQLVRLFGDQAASPRSTHVINWAKESYTAPEYQSGRAARGTFGHPLLREAIGQGRIHWASTEVDDVYGGHVEGAIRAAVRAAERIG